MFHMLGGRGKSQHLAVSITCPLSLITYSHQFLIRAIERCLMCKQSSDKVKPKGYRYMYRKRTKFKIYIYCVYMYKSLVACICPIFVSIHLFFIKNSSLDNCYTGANGSLLISSFYMYVAYYSFIYSVVNVYNYILVLTTWLFKKRSQRVNNWNSSLSKNTGRSTITEISLTLGGRLNG